MSRLALHATRRQLQRDSASFGLGGDRTDLRLPRAQVELIRRVAAANRRTVVAIMAGSAVVMSAWEPTVAGILMLWYPGMEGGHALADIVTGKTSPGGRLPFTIPRDPAHLPPFDVNAQHVTYDLWHGYRKLDRDGIAPHFPFGFGLTFTDFAHAGASLERTTLGPTDTLTAHVEVTNTGAIPASDVVQLYVQALDSQVERAKKTLVAFTKVPVAPGQTKSVTLTAPATRFAYFDEQTDGFVVEPGRYRALIARHANDESAAAIDFTIRRELTGAPLSIK